MGKWEIVHNGWIRIWIKAEDQRHFAHLLLVQSCPLSEKKKALKHRIVLKWVKKTKLSIDLNSSLRSLHGHLSEFHASPVKSLALQATLKHPQVYFSLRWHYCNAYQPEGGKTNTITRKNSQSKELNHTFILFYSQMSTSKISAYIFTIWGNPVWTTSAWECFSFANKPQDQASLQWQFSLSQQYPLTWLFWEFAF